MYLAKLRDDNGRQIGLRLSVRKLQASARFDCVLENKYAVVKQSVHVSVIDSNNETGSGKSLFICMFIQICALHGEGKYAINSVAVIFSVGSHFVDLAHVFARHCTRPQKSTLPR